MWLLASPDNREARLARQCLRADHWTLFGPVQFSAPSVSRLQIAKSFMDMQREMLVRPSESDDRAI
eukprot:7124613-Alexandrium_andersonii.AAC.1